MINITVALSDVRTHGGAKIFFDQLISHLPQYNWQMTESSIPPDTDVLIYGNRHDFYTKATQLKIPKIIQRTQGQRAMNLQQPDDLHAVICSSQQSFNLSNHPRKTYICNGVDYDLCSRVSPIPGDILCSESRISKGQKVETAIKYAIKHNRKLTILGSQQHAAENTYDTLRKKYPQMNWVGLVSYEESIRYIKGCKELIMASSAHGLSNSVLLATHFNKPIINLGGVEIPNEVPDIKETAQKYVELIDG